MEDNKQPVGNDSNSLENLEEESTTAPQHDDNPAPKEVKPGGGVLGILRGLVSKLNIYLLAFALILIVALIIVFVAYQSSKEAPVTVTQTQELTQSAIDNIIGSDSKVGDPKQLLTVESNAVFSGKVLIREGLDVAGPIKVGGSLSLPGITVSGTSAFDEVVLNTLNVSGDVTVQGQLSVQKGLTVSGPVTFSGTFSVDNFSIESLTVNQNLTLKQHIDAGGPSPSVAGGGALGSGGTATLSGTDTAGTVTANIGSGASSGVLATVTFANVFGGIPHVIITPIAAQGSATVSGTQKFYLSTRTSTGFTIATSGALPTGSISFDFIVID